LPLPGVLETLRQGISQSPWHCLFKVSRFGQVSQAAVEIAPFKARQIFIASLSPMEIFL
jgi:hypothetical protein